nr:L766 [uncultured bacterium]
MPSTSPLHDAIRVGVDTGGTFTDFVFESQGQLQIFKLPSTPNDPSRAIIKGLNRISELSGLPLRRLEVIHGTTVGTNALLQRRGAKIALVTTKGFEDVIAIGRQARPELYNLDVERPAPLVSHKLRIGITERVSASGEVITALNEEELESIVARLSRANVQSVAISLLFSFVHPAHERRIAAALNQLDVPLSVSHELLPEYREYERTSTVTINAYLQPLMGAYSKRLQAHVPRLSVMQSSGGIISAQAAAQEPVRTILSGPAGGVVGALSVAQAAGFSNLITFDMGGTSTDVSLCDREGLRMTNEAVVAGLPVAVSVMDIHTIGAGGGSIARVDEGGSLRVGPESAGADPGPACYGRSFLPTVTDAHAVLGHFGNTGLLGGEFKLDTKRALEAMKRLAVEMSKAALRKRTPLEAAAGVISVVNTNMERALRRISVERGHDPREFALIPFGGAGGLHAVELARALRIPRVVIPTSGGALSAIGVLTADVVKDQSRTVMLAAQPANNKRLEQVFRQLENRARKGLAREGFPESRQRHERSVAMRYKGQAFELEIKAKTQRLADSFHRAHEARYGYAEKSNAVEIVSARVRSSGLVPGIARPVLRKTSPAAKARETVLAYFAGKREHAGVYRREELLAGMKMKGPAIVTEYSATTLIPPGSEARVDHIGNVIIEIAV